MQSSKSGASGDLDHLIFFGSVLGIVSLCVPLALYPEEGGVILGRAFDFLTQNFGVFYVAGATLYLRFFYSILRSAVMATFDWAISSLNFRP